MAIRDGGLARAAELIPPGTLEALRPSFIALTGEIVGEVGASSDEYAIALENSEGLGIRLAIEQAVNGFLEQIEHPDRPQEDLRDVAKLLGESEFRAGRSLEALQAAWRVGARAAWRGAAGIIEDAGLPHGTLAALAESIFSYIDELADGVVEGYVRAQSDEAGERERHRRQLARALVESDPDQVAIERAAALANWTIPAAVAVLALAGDAHPPAVAARLDADVLHGSDSAGGWLLIPDPEGPGRAAQLERAGADAVCALGPAVAPLEAAQSLRWARTTLALVGSGALPEGRPTRTADHLATVIVLQDRALARLLGESRLAPLAEEGPAQRARLLETLGAWLEHQRHVPSVAEQLGVHPQTVRYRMAKLRELFGAELDTPDGRFELGIALRAAA